MDRYPIIQSVRNYIETVIKQSMESEDRRGEVRYTLAALIDDKRKADPPGNSYRINGWLLIVNCMYARVRQKIRYRLRNNFEKNFRNPLSYYDFYDFEGPIRIIVSGLDSSHYMTMSTTILSFSSKNKGKPSSFICSIDSTKVPVDLKKYMIPERQNMSTGTFPIVKDAEKEFQKLYKDKEAIRIDDLTCGEEWQLVCTAWTNRYGNLPPAIDDLVIFEEDKPFFV